MQTVKEMRAITHKLMDLIDKLENKEFKSLDLKKKKVIIDAGHGGEDSGAIGPTGLKEAESVLIIAHLLGQRLRDLDIETIMTRITNKFISLPGRVELTKKHRDADCFISIHHNAVADARVSGIETYHYYNSYTGSELAEKIQAALMTNFPEHNDRGVKGASYHVIKYTPMTAALAELEFITNLKCENEMQKPKIIAKYVNALTNGIIAYLGGE